MKEEKNTNKTIIVLIIILTIIIIGLLIFNVITSKKSNENTTNNRIEENLIQDEYVNPNLSTDLVELSKKSELERIQYYFDNYLFYIEDRDFETAYSKLNNDFKKEHFSTLEKYKEYVINKYPAVNTISYEDYNKLGKYNILTVKFSDILNATDNEIPSFEQKFIFVENELNDYELSFQAE